jgi:hypothetical protein
MARNALPAGCNWGYDGRYREVIRLALASLTASNRPLVRT